MKMNLSKPSPRRRIVSQRSRDRRLIRSVVPGLQQRSPGKVLCSRSGFLGGLLAASLFALGALAFADESGSGAVSLSVSDAWVRAMPPGRIMTAGYARLTNTSDRPLQLIGVSSTESNASLHETRTSEGKTSMVPVSRLTIGPGETVAFEPGGLHIMLMGLETTPSEGERVPFCLETDAGPSCIDAEVRRSPPSSQRMQHHMQH